MNQYYREKIADEFRNCVISTVKRLAESNQTYRPFHTALLSQDVIFWSRFERSFSTSFGQRVIEELARLVALSNGAEVAKRQRETILEIDDAYSNAISAHMHALRSNSRTKHDWTTSLHEIKAAHPTGQTTTIRIISDLWWRKDGKDNFISLKTVKPNIDQTLVAKQDCLYLSVGMPSCNAYFGLPYNPYGEEKADYQHNPPMGIFDFQHDPIVLIGKELWDTIGGAGCYEELLSIAQQVGVETKPIIEALR